MNGLFIKMESSALQPSDRWRGEHHLPLQRLAPTASGRFASTAFRTAALRGLAWLIALALHGGVILLLRNRLPPPPLPMIQPVAVRMVERPAPPAPPVAPIPPSAALPEPAPAPVKSSPTKTVRPSRKVHEMSAAKPQAMPAAEAVAPAVEPAAAVADPAPPSTAAPLPATTPLSADAEPPELSLHCPRRPPPRYPMAARRLGEEGVVELLVGLSADGSVRQVSVSRPSGFDRLDQAAVAAVRLWQCDPIQVAGVPAAATARQRIHFSLR